MDLKNIPKEMDKYIDIEQYAEKFEKINIYNCINIIIFIFVYFNNSKIFSDEFKIIQRILSKVIYYIKKKNN